MIKDKKVVVFTPWGRELTASILYRYIRRDWQAGIVDEWHLWLNTDPDQVDDLQYAHNLESKESWIKVFKRPEGEVLWPKQMNTGRFYQYTQDEDTIYVRMDDDIVWIEENAIKRLVEFRIDNSYPFVVFPIIWNNAVCSYYLQQFGQLPSWWGRVSNYCMDPTGWSDARFAENIHNHLLHCIEEGIVDKLYLHHSVQLALGQQFSVSCFAIDGSEYAKVDGKIVGEEEAWHTVKQPYEQQRANLILPNALISHFSFYPQREYLLTTDTLDRYRELSENV